ncbi:O-antigen ligase family protein [Aliihoeflea sp. PC F10.4]
MSGQSSIAITTPSNATAIGGTTSALNVAFANCLVGIALVYTLLFDVLDERLRVAVAGLLGIAVVLRCLVSWPSPQARTATFLLAGLILSCAFQFIFVADPLTHSAGEYAGFALRLMTSIAVVMYFGHEGKIVSPRLLVVLCVAITLAALWPALTAAPVDYAGTLRPATFTGGPEGVHSSGYVTAAALIGVMVLWQRRWLATGWSILLGAPLLTLVMAYQVRTTWMMVAAYLITCLILHFRRQSRDAFWLLLPIGGMLALLIALAFSANVNFVELSSGRTSVYEERLDLIASRPVPELLFGTGPGSELLPSTVWWWEAKNSHNDFIDLTIQIGVLGLGLFVLLLVTTGRVLDEARIPLYVMFVTSSLFSNGLLARPIPAMLFLAFALLPHNSRVTGSRSRRRPPTARTARVPNRHQPAS